MPHQLLGGRRLPIGHQLIPLNTFEHLVESIGPQILYSAFSKCRIAAKEMSLTSSGRTMSRGAGEGSRWMHDWLIGPIFPSGSVYWQHLHKAG
jgi:hypothetical protein